MTARDPIVTALAVLAAALGLVAGLDMLGLPRPALLAGLLLIVVVIVDRLSDGGAGEPGGRAVARPLANGCGIAGEALSLAAILGIFGAVLAWGHDGLVHLYGIVAGVALIPIVLAGPLYNSGAASVPELVGIRFGHGLPRRLAGLVLIAGCLPILAAQMIALGHLGERLAGYGYETAVLVAAVLAALGAVRGGVRADLRTAPVLWVLTAVALLVPVALVVLDRTGWPVAQFGYGGLVGEVVVQEQALVRRALADPRNLKPIATPYLSLDLLNHLGILLALALGFAAMPSILGRAALASGSGSARRAYVWAVLLLVVVGTALPALATIARLVLVELPVKGTRIADVPAWVLDLGRMGLLKVCGVAALDTDSIVAACRRLPRHPGVIRLQDLSVDAQLLLAALPPMSGLAFTITALMGAGLLAAGLLAMQGPLLAITASLAGDWRRPGTAAADGVQPDRWLTAAAALAAGLIAVWRPTDMLTLIVWGASLAAAGLLPVLLLGMRWRRINAVGAITGMATGLAVCFAYIIGTRFLAPEFHQLFAGLSEASEAAQRRFLDLQQALAAAAPGAGRAAARAALEEHAQRIVGWWGLKSTAAALIAVPAALLATVLASLLVPGARTLSSAEMATLRRRPRARE